MESRCHPNASHQVLAQSDLPFVSRWGLKIFKMATWGHLRYWTRTILAILNLSLRCLPSSLGSFCITVWEEMPFEEFQDGPHDSHLGCRNGTNLAVLNLLVSPVPLTKFQLNPIYCSKADVVSLFSSWPPWRPSWILKWNQFSNSKSPCHPYASH